MIAAISSISVYSYMKVFSRGLGVSWIIKWMSKLNYLHKFFEYFRHWTQLIVTIYTLGRLPTLLVTKKYGENVHLSCNEVSTRRYRVFETRIGFTNRKSAGKSWDIFRKSFNTSIIVEYRIYTLNYWNFQPLFGIRLTWTRGTWSP